MSDFEEMTRSAARELLTAEGVKPVSSDPVIDFGFELGGDGAFSYEDGLRALVQQAVENDRAQRGLTEAVAEVLDDRDAHEAAALVRETDPDDDLWNNYFGPMLDELEHDYTASAREIKEN